MGEWIRSPDRDIEGTVEYISWRHTRVRGFNKNPIYVPNAVFTTIVVENPGRMSHRRIKEVIGLRYDDFAVVGPICDDIRTMLQEHDGIDATQTLIVNFDVFGAASLDLMVYTFTKTVVWVEYHQVKHDVLLKIGQIIQKHGAEIAFPTQTLHVASAPETLAETAPPPPPERSEGRRGLLAVRMSKRSRPYSGPTGSCGKRGDPAAPSGGGVNPSPRILLQIPQVILWILARHIHHASAEAHHHRVGLQRRLAHGLPGAAEDVVRRRLVGGGARPHTQISPSGVTCTASRPVNGGITVGNSSSGMLGAPPGPPI